MEFNELMIADIKGKNQNLEAQLLQNNKDFIQPLNEGQDKDKEDDGLKYEVDPFCDQILNNIAAFRLG